MPAPVPTAPGWPPTSSRRTFTFRVSGRRTHLLRPTNNPPLRQLAPGGAPIAFAHGGRGNPGNTALEPPNPGVTKDDPHAADTTGGTLGNRQKGLSRGNQSQPDDETVSECTSSLSGSPAASWAP